MVDPTPLLELEGIETCYGLSQVLFGLSLRVNSGEMVAMMGRNGMGKTTTIRSIMGMTPARAGAIRFAGSCAVGTVPASGGSIGWSGRRLQRRTRASFANWGLVLCRRIAYPFFTGPDCTLSAHS